MPKVIRSGVREVVLKKKGKAKVSKVKRDNHVPEQEKVNKSSKRRKGKPLQRQGSNSGAKSDGSDSVLEADLEQQMADRPAKRLRTLLPIKTKEGLMERTEERGDTESEDKMEPRFKKPKQVSEDSGISADLESNCGAESTGDGGAAEGEMLKSLAESIKQIRSAKARYNKNMKQLTPEKRKELARQVDAKQVGNFKLPDSPSSKGKGKKKGTQPDHRQWIPCPLMPGVPAIPPPRIPQPWEVLRSQETSAAAEDDGDGVIEGTPPLLTLQGPLSETTAAAENVNDDVIEGTPLLLTLQGPLSGVTKDGRPTRVEEMATAPRAKKRRLRFSPSTEVIQATELPVNAVLADIEFIDCEPTSSTSLTEALGSGWSAISNMSLEIESEPNSASETEEEENPVDISRRPLLNARNAVVEDVGEPSPAEAVQLMCLDAEEDQAIRNMAAGDVDVLHFDWCSEYTNFEGVREKFTGPSGPTFDHSGMSPLQVFQQIWDTSVIDRIVRETNRYARQLLSRTGGKRASRMSRWKDTTREEIWRFLSILILQSLVVNNVEREYWYPSNDQMRIGNFGMLMSFNRFLLLKRCLHFTDNSSLPKNPSKLDKIMPIIAHLNKKFRTLYLPEQNVAIDESLLLWKGRLSFSQKIASKRARNGIKSYELCESRTGYLWKMEVYAGKGHTHALLEEGAVAAEGHGADEPESATSQIVLNLMRPLFGKGHTLVMDNYYNAPLISRILKSKHQTDTMGTLRLNREFVPEGLKSKTRKTMKPDEVCFSSTKDLCVVVFMDNNKIVPMISTFHQPEVGGKLKHGCYRYRPKVVLDYNLSMGGVDRKDQLLSGYPMERSRNVCWYKKLFRRLLNVSILNASVIHDHGRTGSDKLGNRSFRLQLLKEILETYRDTLRTLRPLQSQPLPLPPALSQMHLPLKRNKTQRCKLCYRNKVKRTTVWSCGTCRVNLCILGCYTQYHQDLVNDLENQ